jgi:hypothetical protein
VNGSDPLAVRLTWRWTLLYTRGLPPDAQQRRRLELESDLWEHRQDPDEPDAVREIFGRFLRGIPADVRWRYRTLLEVRGARQRSQDMTTSIRTNWWVILTAVLGAAMLTIGAFTAMLGGGAGDSAFRIIGAVTSVISGGLVFGGLVQRQRSLITGSRLIFAGSVFTLFGGLEFIPIGMIVLISGFWTGNLQLSEGEDEPELHPVRRQQVDMTARWYMWLIAAAVLFGFGFGMLVLADVLEGTALDCDDPDGCLADSALWAAWILSWLGAIVTGGIGVIMGGLRFVVRHRTRLA